MRNENSSRVGAVRGEKANCSGHSNLPKHPPMSNDVQFSSPPSRAVFDGGDAITPDQVVAALMGRQDFVMDGFGDLDPEISARIPNVALPEMNGGLDSSHETIQFFERKQRIRLLAINMAVAIAVAAIAAFLVLISINKRIPNDSLNLEWKVVAIGRDGVDAMVGGRIVNFSVGSPLPSGEVLVSVDHVTQTFSTSNQVIQLRKK